MKRAVIGILAHVDAGKTTLAESILFSTGVLRSQGRVDNGNTALDTDEIEKARGITVFSSQAVFNYGGFEFTLLDTPGHVDFSCETERTLRVIDAAVLVISGIDGVQSHTVTLWNLLKLYNIPVFIFVTKMDYSVSSQEDILKNLQSELSPDIADFSDIESDSLKERFALCSEELLEKHLSGVNFEDNDISQIINSRRLFPCMFGSGLKNEGVEYFLDKVTRFIGEKNYPDSLGARVFKITRDKDSRLVHLKVTGGKLRVKDIIIKGDKSAKINRIRIYTGSKYVAVDEAVAGTVCSVEGLDFIQSGDGLGFEEDFEGGRLEPIMKFRINLPDDCDPRSFYPRLKLLEEEEPSLKLEWNSFLKQINVCLMGKIQAEILKSVILEKYGVEVTVDNGTVQYKETIKETVEGVGHYEPLRHYAEVHLLIEPMPRGSGIVIVSRCGEDVLDRNWQRLILTHIAEKEHLGVLTGSPLTDVKIVLAAGRAHLKHTEGGDFRQATYRAIRQGLMNAESVLLEPWYRFSLTVPFEMLGRAINDIRSRSGEFDTPSENGSMAVIKGRAPAVSFNDYAAEVASYTSGKGSLICIPDGYSECHNSDEIIEKCVYNPESDVDNTPDSVFCAHGAGFTVKWNEVPQYMHLESCLKMKKGFVPAVNRRNLIIDEKELQAIMEREFGKVKYTLYRPEKRIKPREDKSVELNERNKTVIVDGYNVIFASDELKDIAGTSLESAREKLMNILCNYSAFTKYRVILVFDAYKVRGGEGQRFDFHNIHVVYTKERELGDVYIERIVSEIGKNEKVTVVSSDSLIQLSAVRFGVLRMSAREFLLELDEVSDRITEFIENYRENNKSKNKPQSN